MFKYCFLLFFYSFSCNMAVADTVRTSWPDVNFALCEGIGIGASGRINSYADYYIDGNFTIIKYLNINTQGYNFYHSASGRIKYTDASGESKSIILQKPWFDIIRSDSPGESLYLPREIKDFSTSSPNQQIEIKIISGTNIDISLNLLFEADGGNCPTSFSASWKIP